MSLTNGGFNTEEFETQLRSFAQKLHNVNTQQDVICALSNSIISVRENTVILQLYMRVVEEYSSRAPPEHLIPLVYILNDFAQKCKSQAHYTSEALFNIFSQINLYHTEFMAKARRCFNIWKIREIFDSDTLRRLDCALLGLTPPVPSALINRPSTEQGRHSSEPSIKNDTNKSASESLNDRVNNSENTECNMRETDISVVLDDEDEAIKNKYFDLCTCIDGIIRDATSIREKQKIIQSIFSANSSDKPPGNEKLFKLIEMEWELRCNVCLNLQQTLNILDFFHTEIVLKLVEVIDKSH
ncbi:rpr domain-containing protein [Cryptosporidium felis]|nr:rpr domain-containing protein [Cryptosporidium felis]